MNLRRDSQGADVEKVQQRLLDLGWEIEVDGDYGADTEACVIGFQEDMEYHPDVELAADGIVGPETWAALFPEEKVEEEEAVPEGEYDLSTKEGTIAAINNECIRQGLDLTTQIAYVLATVEWETGRTFKPVREAYWLSESWRKQNLRYYPYYGRGYVQLTWKANYAKYAEKLGIDLVNQPDLAMIPENALFILVDGFKTGAFTGKRLTQYVNENQTDFMGARRCINAQDKAYEIAELAEKYLGIIG